MVHLSTIRYIIHVARAESFTRAAAQLFVSQPALSQSIQRFEDEIGMPVFIRERGRLQLTDAGRIVAEEGAKMLESEQRIYSRLNGLKGRMANTVRIGAASSYQRFLLTDALSQLQSMRPDLQIHIHEGFSHNMCQMLQDETLDLALAFEPFADNLKTAPIVTEEIFLAVPPGSHLLSRMSAVPDPGSSFPVADLSLLREEPFIQYPEDRRIQRILTEETRNAGFAPKVSVTGYSTEAANSMAFHGIGMAFVPAVAAQLSAPGSRPRYFRLKKGGYLRTLFLASLDRPELNELFAVLVGILREQAGAVCDPRFFTNMPESCPR